MSTSKVILGIAAGTALGAVLGLLYAPDSGIETRKQLTQKKDDILDSLKTRFQDFLITAASELDVVKQEAEDMIVKAENKIQESKMHENKMHDNKVQGNSKSV
jgi:gas vesicle protein